MPDFSSELKPADPQGPDTLAAERARSSINVQQLAEHLLHRDGFLKTQEKILAVLKDRPYFSKKNQLNLSRPERYQLGLARSKELRRLSVQHGWDDNEYKIADYLTDEMAPYALNTLMFATSLKEQCNEEQRAYWLPKLERWDIIGCYAQTELGHGSNVRGIECQALWDAETKSFVIHSPTLTASKWWVGSLGRTADHAVVVAQLMLPDKSTRGNRSCGPHQFVVQIRDMKTKKPLDGIIIGDIGPKYGYPAMDNGYMLFKNLRVPHSALLSRYAGVKPGSGEYIKAKNSALVYGSLTYVRAQIVMNARLVLARATTIAVRYCSIRRQFADRDAADARNVEMAVLDYPSVQIRLLPLLATTYALHYTGEAMYELYWGTRAQIESGDASRLAEMHAASSGLKSLCTMLAADGIEVCRRAMGGHGFGGGSGIIPINSDYLSKVTVEGDNWMITQQTASYLIKRMTEAVRKPASEPTAPVDVHFRQFLKQKKQTCHFDIHDDAQMVEVFRQRVSYLAYEAYSARVEQKKSWVSLMIQLHGLSRAFSESLLVTNFYDAVFAGRPSPPLDIEAHEALRTCYRLFVLATIEARGSDFLISGVLQAGQLRDLTRRIQDLMIALRPHAVKLVDAWSIPDYLLASSLGRYDGDVYSELFRVAHEENPLNAQTFNNDWRSEEIVMGEGAAAAKARIEALASGLKRGRREGEEKAKL